ncbi:MAG: AEC family transporter [Treponema sp.]|nr:AEC family transporter [Treponema sp.]
MYLLVVKQLVTMMIIVISGFIFAKLLKVGEGEQKFLSKLLLYFINPTIIINSFNLEFNFEKLKQLGFVFFVSLVIHVVMILVAIVTSYTKNPEKKAYSSIDKVSTVFTNCGFVGIPLIRGVFGDEGVFYLMGYLVVFNLLLWTYGYYQMSGSINVKKIVTNPNIICVGLGLIIFCLPFTIPEVLAKPISMISDLNTAVSMILIGILFADFKLPKEMGSGKNVVFQLSKVMVSRLVICVLINIFVLVGFYKLFGNVPDVRMMLFVVLICSACPCATSVPSLSCVFGKDTSYASLVVSVSSLLCMISVPSFVALAELMIK